MKTIEIYETPKVELLDEVLLGCLCETSAGGEAFIGPVEGDDYVIF